MQLNCHKPNYYKWTQKHYIQEWNEYLSLLNVTTGLNKVEKAKTVEHNKPKYFYDEVSKFSIFISEYSVMKERVYSTQGWLNQ